MSAEKFEADYMASAVAIVPSYDFRKTPEGDYVAPLVRRSFRLWQQQAKRYAAEVAELVAALKFSRSGIRGEHNPDGPGVCLCGQCQFVRLRESAIAKFDAPKEQS